MNSLFCSPCQQHLSRSFALVSFYWQNQKYLTQADTGRIVIGLFALLNFLSWNWETSQIAEYPDKTNSVDEEDWSHYWLPVNDRIIFKFLLPTCKYINGLGPVYINELLHHCTSRRSLRSSDPNFLLTVKTINTVTYGDRCFAAIAPKLWNQLPLAIRQGNSVDSFKTALKTYLFCESSFF